MHASESGKKLQKFCDHKNNVRSSHLRSRTAERQSEVHMVHQGQNGVTINSSTDFENTKKAFFLKSALKTTE